MSARLMWLAYGTNSACLPAGSGGGFAPEDLGADLLEWLDAEDASTITETAGAVLSWADKVNGRLYEVTAGTAQPTYSATGFNGRPVITGDGVDDRLTCESTTGLPVGATGCEEWYLLDQLSAAADATTRSIMATGNGSNTQTRSILRVVTGGVNRANARVGIVGPSSIQPTQTTTDFSGRHVYRLIQTGTESTVEVDGVAGTPLAGVPAISTTRKRIFAGAAGAAAGFANVGINTHLVTNLLSAGQATSLYAWLNARNT